MVNQFILQIDCVPHSGYQLVKNKTGKRKGIPLLHYFIALLLGKIVANNTKTE
jgi:hypothetical protein